MFLISPKIQCTLAICISLSYFNIGLVRGYSSTAFPSMQLLRPDLLPTKDIWSWAGSIAPFGGFIGSILSGPLLHFVGRKRTVCIASPVGAIAWTIVATSSSWHWLIAGRILSGVCAGLCLPSAQIYVTECTDARIRGVIGSFPSMSMSAGILVSYVLGCFMPWNTLAWVGCGVALSVAAAVGFLPDSPTWLGARAAREQRAARSRKWLKLERGSTAMASTTNKLQPVEMLALKAGGDNDDQTLPIRFAHIEENCDGQHEPIDHRAAHSWSVLLSGPVLRPLGIGLTLLLIQQVSGIDAVIFFTVDIFRASGSSIDGNVATIIVGALQLGSNLASMFVVDRAGRKPLLIGSALVMSISMACMGLAFYMNELGVKGYG